MKKSDNASPKIERKTIEKNRRLRMKTLCFKLSSFIPNHQNPKDVVPLSDQLDHATIYIKNLKERIEEGKRKKQSLMNNVGVANEGTPVIELRDLGSILELILMSGLNKKFMFYEVISVLEEEGAEVIHANFSIIDDKLFHMIYSRVKCPRIGVEPSRIHERLKKLVY